MKILNPKKSSVLVLMSGGVDSTVAALKLLEGGLHVEGLFLKLLPDTLSGAALDSAKTLADALGIRLHVLRGEHGFEQLVISYFVGAYARGITPNPCILCNPLIKVAQGLSQADGLGIERLATGHYARIKQLDSGETALLKGKDPRKDQSYFLHRISRKHLPRLLFPLGEFTKKEVIEIARDKGLLRSTQKESQEICFLTGDYRSFLAERGLSLAGQGDITTKDGRILGRHRGLGAYTIGQRRGLGIPDRTPYYVTAIDPSQNRLVVGKEEDLLSQELEVRDINWLASPQKAYSKPCLVKIRYRHKGGKAKLFPLGPNRVKVLFTSPQRAVTPGQFAVFYDEDRVLGGGEICA